MKKILIPLIIILLVFILSTCFFTGNTSVSVSPVIKAIGLPSASSITSVELIVSGPGMNTIGVTYDSLPSTIDLTVPSGSDRKFELTVHVDIPIIAATSYKGTSTVNLSQGDAVVSLNMGLGSTKLIVPDRNWNSGITPRVLQFDDISGSNAFLLNFATLGPLLTAAGYTLSTFAPYDIDFDAGGRIYIANRAGSTESGFIRIDNITGLNPIYKNRDSVSGINALTVDRKNGHVYYSTGTSIYRSDLDGNFEDILIITAGVASIQTIQGMAFAENNLIYIVGTTPATTPTVFQYDPILELITANYTMPNAIFSNPWDVITKDDSIYVSNPEGADGWKIIKLSKDLLFPEGYGIKKTTALYAPDMAQGHFYVPKRFVAILNKKITIMDDNSDGIEGALDKLVSMDDITGSNWETFPTSGDGQSLFSFYADC